MKKSVMWLWKNRWVWLACAFLLVNFYGVLRVQPQLTRGTTAVATNTTVVVTTPELPETAPAEEPEESQEEEEPVFEVGGLKVSGVSIESSSVDETVLSIIFSDEVDIEALRRMLSVEPEVDLQVSAHYRSWRRQHYAKVRGKLNPGQSYSIQIEGALQNEAGTACLPESFQRTIRVPDAEPEIRIRHSGRYLSSEGNMRLPLRCVNVTEYTLDVYRIAPRNLVQYAMREGRHYNGFYGDPDNHLGVSIGQKTYTLDPDFNSAEETSVDLKSLLPDELTGAYVVEVTHEGRRFDRRLVVVTDTGISVKRSENEMLVWANSIRTLDAVTNSAIQVWSPTGEILAEGQTDASGLARIGLGESEEEPFLVSVHKGTDLSFLSLDQLRQEVIPDDQVAGSGLYLQSGYEAFLYSDRGVYRPGETAYVQAIVRGSHLKMPDVFPVELIITRPDGRRHSRLQAMLSAEGIASFSINWQDFAATGRYRVDIRTPSSKSVLGTTELLVEEFVPPRIVAKAKADKDQYVPGDTIKLGVLGTYLYGAPASGNPIQTHLYVKPVSFEPEGYENYTFGDDEVLFKPDAIRPIKGALDENGEANCWIKIPKDWKPASMLKGVLTAQVMDQGGRAVTAYTSCDIHAYPYYVGLRGHELGNLKQGDEAQFDWVRVMPTGGTVTNQTELEVTLEKLTWTVVIEKDSNGRYRYKSRQIKERIHRDVLTEEEVARGSWVVRAPEAGYYLATIRDPENGVASSIRFYVGGAYYRWHARSMDRPASLELALDQESYRIGDVARLTVTAPFGGKALLTLEQNDVLYQAVQKVDVNTTVFEIPVTSNLWPNAHASVRVIRPVTSTKVAQVYRATGSIPLRLDAADKQLEVSVQVPDAIRPKQELEVLLQVSNSAGVPQKASYTVAAVDEGICMLTQFQTPDPLAFFSSVRKHGIMNYDLYAALMPETDLAMDTVRSHTGGDIAGMLRSRMNPVRSRRFKPLALWQGVQETDSNGQARVTFQIPEFTGRIRLMVVAASGDSFGSADKQVKIARPVTVLSSLPRFLAPGDITTLPVEVSYIGEGEVSGVLEVETEGPLSVQDKTTREVAVLGGRKKTFIYHLKAEEHIGVAKVRIHSNVGDEAFVDEIEIPIRPVSARSTFHSVERIYPGEKKTMYFSDAMLPGSGEYHLQLSATPEVKYSGAMKYLLQYPYGCLEQTVSKSVPLLYLDHIPNDGTLAVGDVTPMIEHGIARVLSMQHANGSFGYWPHSDSEYAWGTVYALDFLLQAKNLGYDVPEERIASGCKVLRENLGRPMKDATNVGSHVWQQDAAIRAYACQVLANAGFPRNDWAARLLEQAQHLEIDTRLRLVLALADGGRRRDAWTLLENLVGEDISMYRENGGALISPVRTAALHLLAWVRMAPDDVRTMKALGKLDDIFQKHPWHSTQESGMVLMAMSRYLATAPTEDSSFSAALTQGEKSWIVDSVDASEQKPLQTGDPVHIVNHGPGPLYASVTSYGVPREQQPPKDQEMVVRRKYFTMDHKPLSEYRVTQGDLLLVRLDVKVLGAAENVVIQDLLPAGLEIENPNLATSKGIYGSEIKSTLPIRHVDIRDDRILIFAGEFRGNRVYYYTVRAVSPGTYQLPHVSAEEMYDPGVASRFGAGHMLVEAL